MVDQGAIRQLQVSVCGIADGTNIINCTSTTLFPFIKKELSLSYRKMIEKRTIINYKALLAKIWDEAQAQISDCDSWVLMPPL